MENLISADEAKELANKRIVELEQIVKTLDSEIRTKAMRGLTNVHILVNPTLLDNVKEIVVDKGFTFKQQNDVYKTYGGTYIKCEISWF